MKITREIWARLKKLRVIPVPAPDQNGKHTASVYGEKVNFKRPGFAKGGRGLSNSLTNNQRVFISRAARMGLSIREYEIRFKDGER